MLECFKGFLLPLIVNDSWPVRESDISWQSEIVKMLARKAPTHSAAQAEQIGRAARYRPEEVAGAAQVFDGTPVPFVVAWHAGQSVLAGMTGAGKL